MGPGRFAGGRRGATATVTAHLGATYNDRRVSIYAQPYGGKKSLVKTGAVDSHGNLVTSYKLTHNTVFTAAFAGDYHYAPATATRTTYDYVKVSESLSGYYTSTRYGSTVYRVYHHTAKAKLNTTVTPNKAGQCVRFQVQRYYSSAWHTLSTSSCQTLSTTSSGYGTLSLTNAINSKFRMRAEYVHSSKDTTNLSTWGGWQFFTTVCSGDDIHTLAWGPAKATPPAPTAEQIKASAQARLDASLLEGIW